MAVLLIAAWLMWPAGAEPEPAPPPPGPGPTATAAEQARSAASRASPAKVEPAPGEAAPAAPVIDEISLEKKEVCEGEENLVTIKAHTTDGTDPFLRYLVGGQTGQRVPLRTWLPDDEDADEPKVQVKVFGRGGASATADLPPFLVKSCRPARMVNIEARLRANTWGEYELEARLKEIPPLDPNAKPPPPFVPASYLWSFGDGQEATTSTPYATHSYETRRQDRLFSHFLVQVTVRGEGGDPVTGRTSLQLMNPAYEDLATKGVVTLMVQLTPRFPELGPDGVVRQRVRLFHYRDRPVFIHSAVVFRHRINATQPSPPQVVDPFALLGGSQIPPGFGVEFEARLNAQGEPDLFSLEHSLEGKDSEGLPVRGAFSVMRPPPKPTKENSDPVRDALLKKKIMAARKILNRDTVTDEDLWRLEREGKFADLQPPPPAR